MKRFTGLLLSCICIFCLTACTSPQNADNTEKNISQADFENKKQIDNNAEDTQEKEIESDFAENKDTETDEIEIQTADGNKILVAYFSATGTTKKIAEAIADETGADIFEIIPEQPYSSDDLNYSNDDCRANKEQNDETARPAIAYAVDSINDYDTVFVGYPIWWGKEPKIIDTFMESYDFSDKTIIPFCTSGGSGISVSEGNLKKMCPDADFLDGKRFLDSSEVSAWISNLNIK